MKNHLLLYYSLIMFMVAPLAGRVSAHYTYNTWMLPPTPPCGTPGGTAVYTDPMDIIGIGGWQTGSGNGGVITDFSVVPGYNGQALQVTYDLGTTKGAWVQIYHNFDPAVNWSAGDHVRFIHKGTQPNSLEIGLVSSENIPGPNYFGSSWNASSHIPWWTYATWDLKDFYRDDNGVRRPFPDLSQVKGIFISIVNKAPEDLGNSGTIIFDEFQIINIASRAVPASF
ncbi:MAG: hypothetical protein K8I60_11420 [Anaerolineae bacterium]|nr:hypothetical protein [Anaerolineae bacterium]